MMRNFILTYHSQMCGYISSTQNTLIETKGPLNNQRTSFMKKICLLIDGSHSG